jgi:methylglyoxal synthase
MIALLLGITVREENRMANKKVPMEHDKKIALVAHDNKKRDLVEWAKFNRDLLAHHKVYATGTTGTILEQALGFDIIKLQSGPLGGDQQIGAKIVDDEIDFLIFFWDPLEPQPHDPDVKALLRMAVVWNIPIACNRASADFMISSPLMDGEYDRLVTDYDSYRTRRLDDDGPLESGQASLPTAVPTAAPKADPVIADAAAAVAAVAA